MPTVPGKPPTPTTHPLPVCIHAVARDVGPIGQPSGGQGGWLPGDMDGRRGGPCLDSDILGGSRRTWGQKAGELLPCQTGLTRRGWLAGGEDSQSLPGSVPAVPGAQRHGRGVAMTVQDRRPLTCRRDRSARPVTEEPLVCWCTSAPLDKSEQREVGHWARKRDESVSMGSSVCDSGPAGQCRAASGRLRGPQRWAEDT